MKTLGEGLIYFVTSGEYRGQTAMAVPSEDGKIDSLQFLDDEEEISFVGQFGKLRLATESEELQYRRAWMSSFFSSL